MKFAKTIPWLKIDGKEAPYPVLNERSIRATAWIMFLIWIITFFIVIFTKNYLLLNIVVTLFRLEFWLKTIFSPSIAPLSLLWDFCVSNQRPDRVGAIQKRFARWIWLAMATSMIIVAIIFEIRWIPAIMICWTCLLFMRLETSLWICVWCKIYYFLIKVKLLKEPQYRPACPGGSCNIK